MSNDVGWVNEPLCEFTIDQLFRNEAVTVDELVRRINEDHLPVMAAAEYFDVVLSIEARCTDYCYEECACSPTIVAQRRRPETPKEHEARMKRDAINAERRKRDKERRERENERMLEERRAQLEKEELEWHRKKMLKEKGLKYAPFVPMKLPEAEPGTATIRAIPWSELRRGKSDE